MDEVERLSRPINNDENGYEQRHEVKTGQKSSNAVEISLDFIEWQDLSTFVRCWIDGDQVDNLKAAYEAGECVSPVDLFAARVSAMEKDGVEDPNGKVRYYIGDGWHRFHAARELGQPVISAIVHAGGRREALKFALGANAAHGLRRTNKDKRKAVTVAIKEFPTLSARAIAELCHVSHNFANELLHQLSSDDSSRIGKDGKVRRVAAADLVPKENKSSAQLDFFELVGREWAPVLKSFDLTIKSVVWLDDRVETEKKLEAISSMRRQLDSMRVQLGECERIIKAGIGRHGSMSMGDGGPKPCGVFVAQSSSRAGAPHIEDRVYHEEGVCV